MSKLRNTTAHFLLSEDGAVTVDWVVLTAALVGLGLAVMAVVSSGVEDLSGDINTQLVSQEIASSFGALSAPFERNQWDSRTGGEAALEAWMANFDDQNLLTHMTNQAQYANTAQTGHPYDTYHDEFWVARDEAISRGLVDQDDPIPS
ncbi:MAG: hypothetical protein JKY00_15220 [Roseicyclus sp.]|nr:hypothetical protein [Roseicyclus sp.]